MQGHSDYESYQQAVMEYLTCKKNCCYPYDEPDPEDPNQQNNFFKAGLIWFSRPENSISRVIEDASTGDSFSQSELGLFYYVGLQTKKDPLAAELLWNEVVESRQTPSSLKAKIHGYLANLYRERASAQSNAGEKYIASCLKTVGHSVKSVQLGLTSPTVLFVAEKFIDLRRTDVPQGAKDPFQPLWDAYDKRQKEMQYEELAREKRHWKQHKPLCKADAVPDPVEEVDTSVSKPSSHKHDTHYHVELWSMDGSTSARTANGSLASRAIRKDGNTTLLSSKTLDPETLRTLTEKIENAGI
ncbi:hypothetical protein FRC05_006543 [Tulasnella sp. 425]|nr:hypothetical protein FRC05_006543 [Tulasnella sp. 425]